MAANQGIWSRIYGVHIVYPANSYSTLALSATNTQLAFGFIPTFQDSTKQVSKVTFRVSAVAGTLGASDLTCDLCPDSSGVPDYANPIESRATVTATPTGAAFVEFTGFTATSTINRNTQYWFILKNANGTPGTNYPTYYWGGNQTGAFLYGSNSKHGWVKVHATDGATFTTTAQIQVVGFRIEYSDATYDGMVISATGIDTTCYSPREIGAYFVSPPDAILRVSGISFHLRKTSAPTGTLAYKIYTGSSPSLLATTATIPAANISNGTWNSAFFTSIQTINPSTILRIVMVPSAGDSSNYFTQYVYTINNSATDKALTPWGNMQKTYSSDGGSSFTETDTLFTAGIILLLDSTDEFGSSSGGAVAPIGHRIIGSTGR